jgi:hypothetical protein
MQRGAASSVKYHRLPHPDPEKADPIGVRGDARGKNGKRLIRSNRLLPETHKYHIEKGIQWGKVVDVYYWHQLLGQRWLLSATLFGERVITLEFASKKSALDYAESHADETLAWARSRGRGKRSRRNKARSSE